MDVVPYLVFFSLVLVVFSVVLFSFSVRQGDLDHADRLSLLPLERDDMPQRKGDDKAGAETEDSHPPKGAGEEPEDDGSPPGREEDGHL